MKQKKLLGLFGCILAATIFLSGTNASALLLPDPVGFSGPFVDVCVLAGDPACGLGYYESDYKIDGLPVALLEDEFVTYSAPLLDAWQHYYPAILPVATYGVYDFAAGTGGLDVLLYTGAGTKNRNQKVGPDGSDSDNKGDFYFEDPVGAPKGANDTSIDGYWGQDNQLNDGTFNAPADWSPTDPPTITDVNGPVTVSYLLDYLQASGALSIPAFYMDMNQIGQTNQFYM